MSAKGLANDIFQNFMEVRRDLGRQPSRNEYLSHPKSKYTRKEIENAFNSWTEFTMAVSRSVNEEVIEPEPLSVLFIDIETSPLLSYVWGLWDQNVGLNQIKNEWFVLSWAAKWMGQKEILYQDQRNAKKIEDDKDLLAGVWKLLDKADVIIGHNVKRFDSKKLNARFILNGFQPPSSYRQIDTLEIAKKHFQFTSNKLEWISGKLCPDEKKYKTKKFQGFELWSECLKGNPEAWEEMEKYNRQDITALEAVYDKLIPWGGNVNFATYNNSLDTYCKCGGRYAANGFMHSNTGRHQRYRCNLCGNEMRGKENLLTTSKKKSIRHYTR